MKSDLEYLADFHVYVEQDLQWGDMDALRHINNTVYFRYFENARIKLMNGTGLTEMMKRCHAGSILARIEANFKIPLTYPDTIRTYARIKSIGNTSFTVEHVIWSKAHNKIACRGEGVVVMMDYANNKKVILNAEIREVLQRNL